MHNMPLAHTKVCPSATAPTAPLPTMPWRGKTRSPTGTPTSATPPNHVIRWGLTLPPHPLHPNLPVCAPDLRILTPPLLHPPPTLCVKRPRSTMTHTRPQVLPIPALQKVSEAAATWVQGGVC
eukprot:scaffold278020_cov22-Tisochrysis_lutea.AAC.1